MQTNMTKKEVKLKLIDNDEPLKYDEILVKFSPLLKRALEENSPDDVINLMQIRTEVFKKIMEYADMKIRNENAILVSEVDKLTDFSESNKNFTKGLEADFLFELLNAANYLEMDDLIDLVCKSIVGLMKNKSIDDIRTMFNVQNDFSPEEQEQLDEEKKAYDKNFQNKI